MTRLQDRIIDLSRQAQIAPLSPWFEAGLDREIEAGTFVSEARLDEVGSVLIDRLGEYRKETGIGTAVLGMSGGVDSALTAVLFEEAGWRVAALLLPIEQDPVETSRGAEACEALGIEYRTIDLGELYRATCARLRDFDPELAEAGESRAARLRRGNIRARLRMTTLYNMASAMGGLVASTDNYSELGAGFWTLHGDVGDISPIQSLLKSWEVPYLAKVLGVPPSIWKATPTDGLGTGGTDEQQIGATYLEWDIMVATIQAALEQNRNLASADAVAVRLDPPLDDDPRARRIFDNVTGRMARNWFKRINPLQFEHPFAPRLVMLATMDSALFRPEVVRKATQE
jgi:nicotinamide-nucleotide amidase